MLHILLFSTLVIRLQYAFVNGVTDAIPENEIDWSKVDKIFPIESDKEWIQYNNQIQKQNARSIRYEKEKERMKLMKENEPEKYKMKMQKTKLSNARARKKFKANLTPKQKDKLIEKGREQARQRVLKSKTRTGHSTLRSEKLNRIKGLIAEGKATPAQEAELENMRESERKAQKRRREKKKMLKIENVTKRQPS